MGKITVTFTFISIPLIELLCLGYISPKLYMYATSSAKMYLIADQIL